MFPRERKFANLLTKQNRKWQYPAPRFKLKGTTYRPDFFLPDENLYIEVIGSMEAYKSNKKKIEKFKKMHPGINFIIVDFYNNPFPYLKNNLPKNRIGQDIVKIGYLVSEKMAKSMRDLAEKERWSLAQLSVVAMEYYLKLRGYDNAAQAQKKT